MNFEGLFDFTEPNDPEPEDPLMGYLRSYQAPKRPKLDAYSQMLEQMPQRGDYQPGTGGKIANALVAGLAGLTAKSGQDAAGFAEHLKDRPYQQAITDFSLKAKGAKEAADLETEVSQDREKIYKDMFDMQDKLQDNSRQDKEASTHYFRAKTMDKYLKDKAARDATAAEHKATNDDRRAKAAEISANAASSRAGAYGRRVDNQNKRPTTKQPTEAAKATAKKQAMDYLGALNPKYNNFIQRDDYGNIIGYNPKKASVDQKGFEEFVSAVEKMQMQSLMNMPDEPDADEDDIQAEFEN
jgi:hypothetical protein